MLGLDFKSENMGCSALSFSFLSILERLAIENNYYFDCISVNYHNFKYTSLYANVDTIIIKYKSIRFYNKFCKELKGADFVIDFSGGDSFTDIYGLKRFYEETFLKYLAAIKNRLILGPQTIGPFGNKVVKRIASMILKKSIAVFARDLISFNYAELLSARPILCTDIAFLLKKNDIIIEKSGKFNLGINISALMWNGGYSGKNDFGLKIDYKQYIYNLIGWAIKQGYNVYLIPHVLGEDSIEDDFFINQEVKKSFEQDNIFLAPSFNDPSDAKAYISCMDFFVGSRMHSTVAAFSLRVPFIAVAYSRKFEGLFGSLGYGYIINAKTVTVKEALEQTIDCINNKQLVVKELCSANDNVQLLLKKFVDKIREIIEE